MPEDRISHGETPEDDESLVRLARSGSRKACETLFERHRGVAYRTAYGLLGNDQDALDAVQDGLLKAFLGLKNFDGRSGFRTWLVRIVKNAAFDLGRKRGRQATIGQAIGGNDGEDDGETRRPEPSVDDDPSKGLHRHDLRHALDIALARLSPPIRTTFVLFAEAGLSYEEVAETLEIPIGTVMSRLNYARGKLKASTELQGIE